MTANDWKQIFDQDIIMSLFDWIDIDQNMNHVKLQMFNNVSTDIGEKFYQALNDSKRSRILKHNWINGVLPSIGDNWNVYSIPNN